MKESKKGNSQKEKREIKIGLVGATGKVGEVFLSLLLERHFPFSELKLFASRESQGKKYKIHEKECPVSVLERGCFQDLDLVFFSSGEAVSLHWAPEALKAGAFVVDNSAAFRMDPLGSLVVPEVNASLLSGLENPSLIANPNCSTIQLVLALSPLSRDFGLEKVHIATYQAVSGAGKAGEEALLKQSEKMSEIRKKRHLQRQNNLSKGKSEENLKTWPFVSEKEFFLINEKSDSHSPFLHPIAFNCLPQIGSFNEEGFCSEEVKIMNETKKILNLPNLKISAFTVRIPSLNGHGEAVWVTLSKEVNREDILSSLKNSDGLKLYSSLKKDYPHPLEMSGRDEVGVGRILKDPSDKRAWMLWVVGDNLRKGAALNAVQIAEILFGF